MTEETLQKSVILPKNAEIEGAVFHNMIEIPENLAERLEKKLLTPMNTGMSFPKQVIASSRSELNQFLAMVSYSDGTFVQKRVDWEF